MPGFCPPRIGPATRWLTSRRLRLASSVSRGPGSWSSRAICRSFLRGCPTWFVQIEEFMTDCFPCSAVTAPLATVMFTDIVDLLDPHGCHARRSRRASFLEWHHRVVRDLLARSRGTEMDTAGDGFFATFDMARLGRSDAPSQRSRPSILEAFQTRAGVHTGEVENDLMGKPVGWP